jgi:hypothetical protein
MMMIFSAPTRPRKGGMRKLATRRITLGDPCARGRRRSVKSTGLASAAAGNALSS